MKTPIIAGNWKMNGTLAEAEALAQAVVKARGSSQEVDVILCPAFTALATVSRIVKGSRIALGAQDVYFESKGAFTGEISPSLLKDAGCRYCIVGHSERRHILGETDASIHQKLEALLAEGLIPILCVGETFEERQAGRTWEVVERQLKIALEAKENVPAFKQLVVAYEPVWAIGTGVHASPEQAQEVHGAIRKWLGVRFGTADARSIRIQYGGSVKPENVGSLLAQSDVDGALVGGASLDAKAFLSIVEAAREVKKPQCSTA